ncbi:MAG: Fe2+-dependent dioxygenase [Gammaproteobacteria bacterium]|nr:Fe2+-dependent dioxygenase [Gammaproteobacteria bacterium]MDP2140459.1 Fe2+-dependent dioxygenase [Gammaproteobacteria bacterium]MDP2349498.1 Fe2+-dependent dioxygenase [Gammaproteobacteria bacterium]
MLLQIANVLSPDLLKECRVAGYDDSLFTDGRTSAGWHARERKYNLQARAGKHVHALLQKVETALLGHELVAAAARPKTIVRLQFSRYDQGMNYGTHVDDALMDGQRTDLSFTVFLTPPMDYEGGSLVIDEPAGERAFRLDAGAMLLYPSTTLHRVEPVTHGQRLVIVGWIRSYLRSAEAREILFDLERTIALLRQKNDQNTGELELLLKTRSNLLRLWADA